MSKIKIISAPLWQGGADRNVGKSHNYLNNIKFDYKIESTDETSQIRNGIKNKDIILNYCNRLYNKTSKLLLKGISPIIIGGDHTISLATISASSNYCDNLGIIYIDAHGDLNTNLTSPSGNAHGMVLSALLGNGDQEFVNFKGFPKIKYQNIILFGIRDLDPGEIKIIKENNIKVFNYSSIRKEGVIESLNKAIWLLKEKTSNIHISLDLDSINPLFAPGVSVPVSDGFHLDDIKDILRISYENFNVISLDLVEYNYANDNDDKTMNIIESIIDFINDISERN